MRTDIFKSEIMVYCAAIDYTNSSSEKNDESKSFQTCKRPRKVEIMDLKIKTRKVTERREYPRVSFSFDSSCFKRDFRVNSIFQPLHLKHLCVGIEYRFYDNIHFFLLFRTNCLVIYRKTFNWNCRTNNLFVHKGNSK